MLEKKHEIVARLLEMLEHYAHRLEDAACVLFLGFGAHASAHLSAKPQAHRGNDLNFQRMYGNSLAFATRSPVARN